MKHNGNYLNNSTNMCHWEINSSYAIREIPPILNNPTFRYRVHNTARLIFITRDTNAIHTVPLYPFRAQFNIIFHLQLGFSSGFFHSIFYQKHNALLFHVCHVCHIPTRLISLHLIILIMFNELLESRTTSPQHTHSNARRLMCRTKFHTHTKQSAKLQFCILKCSRFSVDNGKTNECELNESKQLLLSNLQNTQVMIP
jgi:hypothetical protein